MNDRLSISESDIRHVTASRTPDSSEARLEAEIKRRALPLVRRSVVPLFAADHRALDQSGLIHVVQDSPFAEIGTATLFERNNRRYLITAEHNLSDWEAKGFEVRVGVNERPRPLRPAIEASEIDSKLDIAVMRLDMQAAGCFVGATFLSEQHIDLDDDFTGGGRYVIPGFLAHRSAFSEDKQALSLANFDLWTRPSSIRQENSAEFAFLEFPLQLVFENGHVDAAPALQTVGGLSGANVWRIWSEDDDLEKWNPITIRSTAVQVRESEDRSYLKCTLWKYVLPLIDKLSC